MYKGIVVVSFLCVGLLVGSASGQPRVWSDPFTAEVGFDYNSWLAACVGGPPVKYSFLEPLLGSIAEQTGWSGGGELIFSENVGTMNVWGRNDFMIIGTLNLGCGMPGVPFYESTEMFTSDSVCIYGAIKQNPWQTKLNGPNDWDIRGDDKQPGTANVDDDADAETDEWDESPAARATTVNNGFGNKDGTGFWAGNDGAPGVKDTDDDANGVTDDDGETGWVDSDDGDDTNRVVWWAVLNVDVANTDLAFLCMDHGSTGDAFSIREIVGATTGPMQYANEIVSFAYFQPEVKYNWVFCVSGTCYGAMLWIENDMSNPEETVGPVSNTKHLADAGLVGMAFVEFGGTQTQIPVHYKRQMKILGNSNFNDTFYVISGDSATHFPPIDADFDDDKDVDGQDFMKFSACFNGSLRPPKTGCANPEANFDGDNDVDGQDFMAFSKCFNGSLRRPKCLPPVLTICE